MMSEATEILEEEQSNPYNMRKPWHKPDGKRMPQADELYYEEEEAPAQQATRSQKKAAPASKETNYKKRYDDLKKHYDNKLSEFKDREQQLIAEVSPPEPEYQAPKSIEELEKFKNDYPDLYDTVETVAHQRTAEQLSKVHEKLSVLEEREVEIAQREAEAALEERHPDFDTIRGSDDFHTWAKEQPEQIQAWVYENPNDVSLAIKALDIYKLESGQGQSSQKNSSKRKQSRASAADMVSTKTTNVDPQQAKIWTETEIAKMSLDQFDKYESDIRQAIDEGRVRNI